MPTNPGYKRWAAVRLWPGWAATRWLGMGVLVPGLAIAGGSYWLAGGGDEGRRVGQAQAAITADDAQPALAQDESTPRVETIRPARGGIERKTVQPGSVHAFEWVDLYANVSGYLKTQNVDIGSHVHKGDVLAVLDVPKEERDLEEAVALVEQDKAQAEQAHARLETVEAERASAEAAVVQSQATVEKSAAERSLADKQLDRIKGLVAQKAVDVRLLDEHQRDYEAALAAERSAHAALATARAQLTAAIARITQAKADIVEAKANIRVAEAKRARCQVIVDFARIVAPFDGVVSKRSFHPGAFVQSASDGHAMSLFTVMRSDLVRVVVQVPDRDVALTNAGDPATITFDALGDRTFEAKVARIAEAEDPSSRTMRAEVDLPNPEGALRMGMYGRVTIQLAPPSNRLAVPAACVISHAGPTKGAVYVVRQGQAVRTEVALGDDNGVSTEILGGLTAEDDVVLRSSAPLADGAAVLPANAASSAGNVH